MFYRKGKFSDLEKVEDFVREAIFPAYYHPDLTDEQIKENERIINISRECCQNALVDKQKLFLVAVEKELAGFVIVDKTPIDHPELDWLIVSHNYQGKGVAQKLTEMAIDWVGRNATIKLGVIHFNQRAIRFYKKFGFRDSGKISGSHKIPRILMLRN